MPDIDDIWDDEEDLAQFMRPSATSKPRPSAPAARLGIAAGAADVGAKHPLDWADHEDLGNDNDAALSQPPAPAEGWRPIETAPKDGSRVLLWWCTRGASVGHFEYDDMFSERPSRWVSPEFGWRSDGDQCIPVNQEHCTRWMPLPAAPEARS